MYKIAEEASKLQLSTPSLGITILAKLQAKVDDLTVFQLPLSGSQQDSELLAWSGSPAFNSLSRDHNNCEHLGICRRIDFQLPLSGSLDVQEHVQQEIEA